MTLATFSTQDIPVGKRTSAYQDTMNQLFSLGLQINPDEQEPFDMRMTAYSSPWLRFAALRFSPHTTTRRVVADSSVQTYFLLGLQKEGKTTVVQDGREAAIEPGDLFLVDTGRPFHLKTGAIQTKSLYIPANQLREVFAEADALTAVRIRGDSGAGSMLRGMVDELFDLAPNLDELTASRISTATPHVVAMALSQLARTATAIPPRLERYHKDRIRRFVRTHLHDPNLTAEMIARGVDLSPRHVYELFSGEPVTLMKSIWIERLERCKEELSLPLLRHRTISEIAYSWGFRDLAHFSRSFRSRFQQTPREYRRRVLGASADAAGTAESLAS
jgi:AraC family transcriptional activator of tynA and feaB